MSFKFRRVGFVNDIINWLTGSQYDQKKATQVVENYVKNNFKLESVSNYLDRLASTVKVDTKISQDVRNIIRFDKSNIGELNLAQRANIKSILKNIINSENVQQVSNDMRTKFDESLKNFQDKMTADFGSIFEGKGQNTINNFVNDIQKRYENNFSKENIANTFANYAVDQKVENIISANESDVGKINFAQEATADVVVESIIDSVSKQLLDNKDYTDITKSIINEQHKKDTGLEIGQNVGELTKIPGQLIQAAENTAKSWFDTWKWVIIAAAIVVVVLIVGIIIFFMKGGLGQVTDAATKVMGSLPPGIIPGVPTGIRVGSSDDYDMVDL